MAVNRVFFAERSTYKENIVQFKLHNNNIIYQFVINLVNEIEYLKKLPTYIFFLNVYKLSFRYVYCNFTKKLGNVFKLIKKILKSNTRNQNSAKETLQSEMSEKASKILCIGKKWKISSRSEE